MTKPKLLIAADTYTPKKDGLVRFLKEIVPRLAEDFHVTLLVPNFEHKRIETKKTSTTIVKFPVSKVIGIAGYQAVKFTNKNKKTIKKYVQEADVVFIQDLAPIGIWSLRYAKKFNKLCLAFIHQINWEQLPQLLPRIIRSLAKFYIKRKSLKLYNQCDTVIVPYKTLGRELKDAGLETKTDVARLGLNADTFRPSEDKDKSKIRIDLDSKKKVVGYLGRISDEKNLDVLFETFKELQEDYSLQLLIVGDGDKKIVEKYKKHPHVKVTGFVANVVPYLQAMDIFVMPSLTETTSLAILEAMGCGIPVITTKVGFPKEYIVKNHNGLLFPKGNQYNLKIQLKKLLDNPKLRKTLSHHARTTAKSFSWDKTAEKIKGIIEKK